MGVAAHRAPRGGDAARVRRATIRHAVAAGIVAHPGATVRTLARALHLEDLSVKKALEHWRDRGFTRSVRVTTEHGIACLWFAEHELVALVQSGAIQSLTALEVADGATSAPNPWVHPYRVGRTVSTRQTVPLDYASPLRGAA